MRRWEILRKNRRALTKHWLMDQYFMTPGSTRAAPILVMSLSPAMFQS